MVDDLPPPIDDDQDAEDIGRLLLIVVGSHLRAERADRPLAYQLQENILQWLVDHADELAEPEAVFDPVVCSDIWFINNEDLHPQPTISIGGPGVNALSAYFVQKLDSAMVRDQEMIIQLDPEFVDLRVSVWGQNHDQTVQALDVFMRRYLPDFLRAVATQIEPRSD